MGLGSLFLIKTHYAKVNILYKGKII